MKLSLKVIKIIKTVYDGTNFLLALQGCCKQAWVYFLTTYNWVFCSVNFLAMLHHHNFVNWFVRENDAFEILITGRLTFYAFAKVSHIFRSYIQIVESVNLESILTRYCNIKASNLVIKSLWFHANVFLLYLPQYPSINLSLLTHHYKRYPLHKDQFKCPFEYSLVDGFHVISDVIL